MHAAARIKAFGFRLLICTLLLAGVTVNAEAGIHSLILAAPADQAPYVRNGNILTVHGTVSSNATLVSATLEDEHHRTIRDIEKAIQIDAVTGILSGKVFVGSFRSATSLFLRLVVTAPSLQQPEEAISNILFVDNAPPDIRITTPEGNAPLRTFPIIITGTAEDSVSGVTSVQIRLAADQPYIPVSFFNNNHWRHDIYPSGVEADYTISVRARDRVGHLIETDPRIIHYVPPPPREAPSEAQPNPSQESLFQNAHKSPDADGICTYRVTDLANSRFQATELFALQEEMAIIVKGYGGQRVTIRIMTPEGNVIFELEDFIPLTKNKMWRWKINAPGSFKAVLFVDGVLRDDIFFKVLP